MVSEAVATFLATPWRLFKARKRQIGDIVEYLLGLGHQRQHLKYTSGCVSLLSTLRNKFVFFFSTPKGNESY